MTMIRILPAIARRAMPVAALVLALVPRAAQAQSARLESAYVVLGPQGAVARAPDAMFAVLVCEMPIPASATAASIENAPLPLPRSQLKSIAAFGDTGCRLKAAKGNDGDDDDDGGKYQECNNPAAWPFAQVAASIAAAKPDLVIHVGDYLYRESACPPRDAGCARSPHGDDWPTWNADFFAPAAPALLAAPWIMVRGNHEICSRAGAGYLRLLDQTPAQTAPPCIDLIPH